MPHRQLMLFPLAILLVVGCSLDAPGTIGGPPGDFGNVFVLNAGASTISRFEVASGSMEKVGSDLALPVGFDGEAIDVAGELFATSSGTEMIVGSLSSGAQEGFAFPGVGAGGVDPSPVTVVADVGGDVDVWVAGRNTSTIYRLRPDVGAPSQFAAGAGQFIVRLLPIGATLVALDANVDDDGEGELDPLPPPNVLLYNLLTETLSGQIELSDAVGAVDGIVLFSRLYALAGGSFRDEGGVRVPNGDGSLVVVDLAARRVIETLPLGGNGVALEAGLDGRLYITRTTDQENDILRYDPFSELWERGPDDPVRPTDASGAPVSCRAVTGLRNNDVLCIASAGAGPGRLFRFDAGGGYRADLATGAGPTDIVVR